jgi:hypothetical protein
VYAAVEPCLVQKCAPSGGCADGERRVCTEFVGTGNGVLKKKKMVFWLAFVAALADPW